MSDGAPDEPMGPEAAEAQRPPTQEEIAAAFVQRLGRTPVRDILMQTMATLTDVAGIRLGLGPEGEEVKDLEQARLAIETLRSLLGVADAELGSAATGPFRDPLAQLQMAYAQIAEAAGQTPPPSPADTGEQATPAGGRGPDDPASRLWVPGR